MYVNKTTELTDARSIAEKQSSDLNIFLSTYWKVFITHIDWLSCRHNDLFHCIVQSLHAAFVQTVKQYSFPPSDWQQLASIGGATRSRCVFSPAKQFLNKNTLTLRRSCHHISQIRQWLTQVILKQLIDSDYSCMTLVVFWTSPPEKAPSAFCCTTD